MTLSTLLWIAFFIIVAIIIVSVLIWWIRTHNDPGRHSFFAIVRRFEKEIGAINRYQTPWVLALGEGTQRAEQLCQSIHLQAKDPNQWFGRWWYGVDGAVLIVPDELFLHTEGALQPLFAWRRLLNTLLRARAKRPVDSIIWTVSATKLWQENQAISMGIAASAKFADLLQRLGVSTPVYLVVTEMEQIPGFLELAETLPAEARDSMIGWSSSFQPNVPYQSNWIDLALGRLKVVLNEAILEIGTLKGGIDNNLYLLPRQFERIRHHLQSLCDPVFRGNALGEAPLLRGIYFTGEQRVTTEGQDETGIEETEMSSIMKPLFSGHILRERVLAEQGLSWPILRILQLQRRWQKVILITIALFGAVWFSAMIWYWQSALNNVGLLNTQLATLRNQNVSPMVLLSDDAAAKRGIESFWRALQGGGSKVPLSSILLPTSLFSSLDENIDAVLSYKLRNTVLLPLRQALIRVADRLVRDGGMVETADTETSAPDKWLDYLAMRQLVNAATKLEQNVNLFNRTTTENTVDLDGLASLSNNLLGTNINTKKLALKPSLEKGLLVSGALQGYDINMANIAPAVRAKFTQHMLNWLNNLYSNENFERSSENLVTQLQHLESGRELSPSDLDEMTTYIALLNHLVTSSTDVWGKLAGQQLVPGFSSLMDTARRSTLISSPTVNSVLQRAAVLRQGFANRWLSGQGAGSVLFVQTESGSVKLQEAVAKLNTVLSSLSMQPFFAIGLNPELQGGAPLSLSNINPRGIQAALDLFNDYKKYVATLEAGVPPQYLGGLNAVMQKAVSRSMFATLNANSSEMGALSLGSNSLAEEGLAFDGLGKVLTPLISAFVVMNQHDFANIILNEMNRRAVIGLKRADQTLQSMAVYQPYQQNFSWWDGTKGAGNRAFRANNDQELQQYLVSQLAILNDVSAAITPLLMWLSSQQSMLSVSDKLLVQRWLDLANQLKLAKEKAPNSGPAILENFVSRTLNNMDLTNCKAALDRQAIQLKTGFFAERTESLYQQANKRCMELRMQAGGAVYLEIANYFNQYLANRFPFSAQMNPIDVVPERLEEFQKMLELKLPLALAGLQDLQPLPNQYERTQVARDFLNALQSAQPWLKALLQRDTTGSYQGIDLDIRWRTDRQQEVGADQVIAWSIDNGGTSLTYPGGTSSRLHWRIGQPLNISLRWAKESPQIPQQDSGQSYLAVSDRTATWNYAGNWALLSLLRDRSASVRLLAGGANDVPVMLNVPVQTAGAALKPGQYAKMYLHIGLVASDGKTMYTFSPLPVTAPASPFPMT